MMFLNITFCLLTCVCDSSAVDIMPELKRNILNFGCGVNFKYKGMLSHSFDRFYVVVKYELLKVNDLKLTTIEFDHTCSYLDGDGKYMTKLKRHCRCRFLILFGINCIVEPSSRSQKQNQISLLSQAFASKPNMAFSSVWENV